MPAGQDINPQTGKAYAINPQTGVWDDNYFAKTYGGGGSGGGGSSDYYGQALAALQPQINAQVQPLQQTQDLLPTIYGQKQQALQDQQNTTQQLFGQQIKGIQDQSNITKEQIGEQTTNQLGQQRANAAANGFASSSGVEQSQEANISNQTAVRLAQLDQATNDQTSQLGIQEDGQVKQIADQIAQLPTQEAQDSLNIGMQIAKIKGEGAASALSYASSMAQLGAQMAYQQAEIAHQQNQDNLALESLRQTINYQTASLKIQEIGAGAQSTEAAAAAAQAKNAIARDQGFIGPDGALVPGAIQTNAEKAKLDASPKTTVAQTPHQGILGGLMNWLFGQPTTKSTTSVGGWQ